MKISEIAFLFHSGAALIQDEQGFYIAGKKITQEQFIEVLGTKFSVLKYNDRKVYTYER